MATITVVAAHPKYPAFTPGHGYEVDSTTYAALIAGGFAVAGLPPTFSPSGPTSDGRDDDVLRTVGGVLDEGSKGVIDRDVFDTKPTQEYLYSNFSGLPGVPSVSDNGLQISYSGSAAPVQTADGITVGAGTGQRAMYGEVTLPGDVKSMEVEFKFNAGTGSGGGDGSVVLIPWKNSITGYPAIPATGIHMVIRKDAVIVSYFDASLVNYTTYLTKKHAAPLVDGVWYRAGWSLIDTQLSVLMPDGQVVVITEASITSRLGPYAGFEIYQYDGATDQRTTIRKIKASHHDPILSGVVFSGRAKAETDSVCVSTTSGATASVPLSAAALIPGLAGQRVPKGPTGKCNIRLGAWVSANPSGTVVWVVQLYLDAAGTLTYGNESRLIADAGQVGQSTVDILMTIPDEPVYMKWQQWCTASGATMDVQVYRPAVILMTPI